MHDTSRAVLTLRADALGASNDCLLEEVSTGGSLLHQVSRGSNADARYQAGL